MKQKIENNNPQYSKLNMQGLSGSQWEDKLSQIARKIKKPTKLTLMGSAPNMLRGQPSRMSIDLDIWKQTSTFDKEDIKQAVESTGLLFNPTQEIPDKPYIQIVEAGICQLGKFSTHDLQEIQSERKLCLQCPPIENLIASKLLRSEPKDLEDINWMVNKYRPNVEKIKEIIHSFPAEQRQKTLENIVYIEVMLQEKQTVKINRLPNKSSIKLSKSKNAKNNQSIDSNLY